MRSYSDLQKMAKDERIKNVCEDLCIEYKCVYKYLIDDIVNAFNTIIFSKAVKRIIEQKESQNYVHSN